MSIDIQVLEVWYRVIQPQVASWWTRSVSFEVWTIHAVWRSSEDEESWLHLCLCDALSKTSRCNSTSLCWKACCRGPTQYQWPLWFEKASLYRSYVHMCRIIVPNVQSDTNVSWLPRMGLLCRNRVHSCSSNCSWRDMSRKWHWSSRFEWTEEGKEGWINSTEF